MLEANEVCFNYLRKGIALESKNQVTGDSTPTAKLIDFDNYENNDFTAINQFRINTPGTSKSFIIPDIVCFVNGLPFIVIECKDEDVAEPMSEAFEKLFNARTEEERLEIMKRYGGMEAYLESQERVKRISENLFDHYVKEILPNGFKAMVVSSSIIAASRYSIQLRKLIEEYKNKELTKPEEERDEYLLNRLSKLQVKTVISEPGNNADSYVFKEYKEGRSKSVQESFCKDFSDEKGKEDSNIGILSVCDRLLTGFDAPVLQVMYLDKNLREQNLMQAIARVNRTKKHKSHGIVVDYFGVLRNLQKALGIYTDQDKAEAKNELEDFESYFSNIEKEKIELEERYKNLLDFIANQLKIENAKGYLDQTLTAEQDVVFVENVLLAMKDINKRSNFNLFVSLYLSHVDLLFTEADVQQNHYIRAKRLGFLVYKISSFFKDKTMDLKYATRKVRNLIDKYVKSLGIDPRFSEMSILSDEFIKIKKEYKSPQTMAAAIEYSLRDSIKDKLASKDPGLYQKFNTRIENILKTYKENWEMQIIEFEKLKEEFKSGEKQDSRFVSVQPAFYRLLTSYVPDAEDNQELDAKIVSLIKDKLWDKICKYISEYDHLWEQQTNVQKFKDDLKKDLRLCKIKELKDLQEEISSEFVKVCKNNYKELTKYADKKTES